MVVQQRLRPALARSMPLQGLQGLDAAALGDAIAGARQTDEVARAGRVVPALARGLLGEGLEATAVARTVALTLDAITRRLIELAFERLGPAPVPWAWLALGSAGRLEQAIATDQDHALAFEPMDEPLDEVDPYFLGLATSVRSGLEAAGIPRCRAGVIAENPALRRPVDHWRAAFEGWIAEPGASSARQGSILFDVRRVAGPLEIEPVLAPVIRSASRHPAFIRQLARQSLQARPVSRVRDGVAVDVKREGLTPIVNLARSYALESGISEPGTLLRLELAARRGRIDEETHVDLAKAFQLLWRIRLEHHAAQVAVGGPVDDLVDPATLDPSKKVQLHEALRILRRARRRLRRQHRLLVPGRSLRSEARMTLLHPYESAARDGSGAPMGRVR